MYACLFGTRWQVYKLIQFPFKIQLHEQSCLYVQPANRLSGRTENNSASAAKSKAIRVPRGLFAGYGMFHIYVLYHVIMTDITLETKLKFLMINHIAMRIIHSQPSLKEILKFLIFEIGFHQFMEMLNQDVQANMSFFAHFC